MWVLRNLELILDVVSLKCLLDTNGGILESQFLRDSFQDWRYNFENHQRTDSYLNREVI